LGIGASFCPNWGLVVSNGGFRYNQGRGSAPARSLDTIKIATLLSQSLTAGKLSQEEYELILRTTSRAALAGAL